MLQVDHLRAIVLMMVPGVRLDAAHNEILRGNAEIKRLQRALQGTVAADALRRAEDDAAGLAAQAARLRAALDAMVPAARHAAAQEECRRAAAEAQRLAGLMEGMVPREQFLACQTRADQARAQGSRSPRPAGGASLPALALGMACSGPAFNGARELPRPARAAPLPTAPPPKQILQAHPWNLLLLGGRLLLYCTLFGFAARDVHMHKTLLGQSSDTAGALLGGCFAARDARTRYGLRSLGNPPVA